jgi:hypothetical protein
MNTNINTVNTDANNEAAKTLSSMFAGHVITKVTIDGGANVLNLANGNTIAIRHDVKTYDIVEGYDTQPRERIYSVFSPRAEEAIKRGQTILTAWVEKREINHEARDYDSIGETEEVIELWAMFEGDLRPTLLVGNETSYYWNAHYPDFTITSGDSTVTASDAYVDSEVNYWR